jgi:hypothetical protein
MRSGVRHKVGGHFIAYEYICLLKQVESMQGWYSDLIDLYM